MAKNTINQIKCTKNLTHQNGTLDFKKGGIYDVIDEYEGGLILRNERGETHRVSDAKWGRFFSPLK